MLDMLGLLNALAKNVYKKNCSTNPYFAHSLVVCLTCIVNTPTIQAQQNLLADGSFEQSLDCPHDYGSIRLGILRHWRASPADCTPDYFHECSKKDFSIKNNVCGGLQPHHGHAYAGIIIRTGEGKNPTDLYYKEAIQTQLTEPLQPNARYILRFYVARAEYSNYAAGNIGALLTPYPVEINSTTDYPAQIKHPEIITSTQWVKIEDTLIAKGGEQYLTIGEFERYEKRQLLQLHTPEKYKKTFPYPRAYYFIDDISLTFIGYAQTKNSYSAPSPLLYSPDFGEIYPGKPILVPNIKFRYNSADLLPQSEVSLKKLHQLLLLHPHLHILIIGHTDESGSTEYNQLLSEERAQRVALYLMERGIAAERIRFRGRGADEPIEPDNAELNRRVEFILYIP